MRRMPTTCRHASFIDTLPLTNQRGLRSDGSLRLVFVQWHPVTIQMSSGIQSRFKCPVATGGIQSRFKCLVATGGIQSRFKCPVATGGASHVQWQQVSPGGSAIAFRLRLGGRINPDRASTVTESSVVEYSSRVSSSNVGFSHNACQNFMCKISTLQPLPCGVFSTFESNAQTQIETPTHTQILRAGKSCSLNEQNDVWWR
jgi:hypothetical protein